MSRVKAAAGFTLLEVIIAMTILGLGFAVMFAGMSQSARNITKLEKVERREMYTRNLLAQLDLVQQLTTGDASSGTFDDGTRWRLEIEPYVPATPQMPTGLVRVELRLEWDATAGIQRRTIETYRLVRTMVTASPVPVLDEQFRALQ